MQGLSGLAFTPLLPVALLAALTALSAAVVAYGAWARARGMAWRAVVLAAGLLALLNPTLIDERRESLPDVVALVIDSTASQDIGARRAQTAKAADSVRARLDSMDDLELRVVTVAADSGADGSLLFAALAEALSDVPADRVAGAILITDGQVHDAPEVADTVAYAGPVHVLLTGQRNERDRRLVIEQAPTYGIVGDRLSVTVLVDDPGAAGQMAELTVRVAGQRVRRAAVEIGKPREIAFELDRAGVTALELSVAPGDAELTLENNRAVVVVNGVRDRLRVMLVSGAPSPGLRTWRNLLKADPSVDLIHFTILRPPDKQDMTPVRELSLIPFPSTELFATNLKEFDLIIFDRYHRRGILPMLYLANVVDYVMAGGAVLDMAGPAFASPLSLASTPLGAILPGRPTGMIYEHGFRPRLTAEGLRHPVTAGLPGAGGAIKIAGGVTAGAPQWGRWFRQIGAEVHGGATLMRGHLNLPLLVLDRVGEGRVAQLLSDQSWLWARGFEGGGPQADLLRRLVHWLMKEPDLEENSLTARVDGDRIVITRRSLEPIGEPVTVLDPSGESRTVVLSDQGEGRAGATLTVADTGLYRLQQAGESAIAVVGAVNPLEVADVRATETVLAPVVAATGGGIHWLVDRGAPDIRRARPGRETAGRTWIGLTQNRRYLVTGLAQAPVLPAIVLLVLLLGGLILAWRAEGR